MKGSKLDRIRHFFVKDLWDIPDDYCVPFSDKIQDSSGHELCHAQAEQNERIGPLGRNRSSTRPSHPRSSRQWCKLGCGATWQSLDTSMSFTPAAGVPMGTRSGDLDPGLVWYLSRTDGVDAKQFNEMVNFKSGLLGISETSSDIRELLDNETQDVRAADAVALFCYQVKKWIGAFAAALGGIDTLIFAGGIGENAPIVRARICEGLGFLGIELEEKQNATNEGLISTNASRVSVRVIHTDEEWMIAHTVCSVLGFQLK